MLVYHEEYASNLEYTLHVHGSELEALFRKAYRGGCHATYCMRGCRRGALHMLGVESRIDDARQSRATHAAVHPSPCMNQIPNSGEKERKNPQHTANNVNSHSFPDERTQVHTHARARFAAGHTDGPLHRLHITGRRRRSHWPAALPPGRHQTSKTGCQLPPKLPSCSARVQYEPAPACAQLQTGLLYCTSDEACSWLSGLQLLRWISSTLVCSVERPPLARSRAWPPGLISATDPTPSIARSFARSSL